MLYFSDRSSGGSSPYIRFIFLTHSPSEVERHLYLLVQQRVIIVGIQCFFFESLPTKTSVILWLCMMESFVLTISYLTGAQRCWLSSSLQPKYQKMDGVDAETSL